MQTNVHINLKDAVVLEIVEIQKRKFRPDRVKIRITLGFNSPKEHWMYVNETYLGTINIENEKDATPFSFQDYLTDSHGAMHI